MKLTEDQIDRLYQFTRQHFVEWYDLQSELVDHLANSIEDRWKENPKLNFEEALQLEFKKFGVFGFMDVVEERQKFLGKKYGKMIWKYYKEFFKLPKILLTFGAIYVLYLISEIFQNTQILYLCVLAVIGVASGLEIYKVTKAQKQREKITGKKWLFEQTVSIFDIFPITLIPAQLVNLFSAFGDENWNRGIAVSGAIILVLFALLLYVQWKIVHKRITEEMGHVYPEYQISK